MSTSEFDIIDEFFTPGECNPELIAVGIGDDAAIINTNPDEQLVISVDTLNIGVHFPAQSSAYDVGYKALAVNLSDMAAMGAEPKWFTLALSLPSVDKAWLNEFSQGMLSLAAEHRICLIGGDTTKGPLSITVQIAGTVPVGQGLQRDGARVGDDIYVTGSLGDAAAALAICENRISVSNDLAASLLQKLNQPVARVDVGQMIRLRASSCIDISDGFAADLGHILEKSHVGAEIDLAKLPVSKALTELDIDNEQRQSFVLYGGDDYELCFTAPEEYRSDISAIAKKLSCGLSIVGKIVEGSGLFQINDHENALEMKGFDHFK